MNVPRFLGLPSASGLHESPQRAILSALDASLVLAVRALRAHHANFDTYNLPDDPLLLLAESVLASATGLHTILVASDDLAERMARLEDGDSPPDDGDDLDIPF